ncbi:MAG: nitrous oxide reductase accessory protein NosL [Ferruginibacter sp.]
MKPLVIFVTILFFASCTAKGPEPVQLNVDACTYCKMPISDARYAAEIITKKGRLYKFDDAVCIISYSKEKLANESASFYFSDFEAPGKFVKAPAAVFIKGGNLKSPMAGNTAAFGNRESAGKFAEETGAQIVSWEDIQK